MRVQGRGGTLRTGGRFVADVLAWTITDSGAEYAVSAQLGSADEFLIEQAARFDVELHCATHGLHWHRQPAEVIDGELKFRTGRISSNG